MLFISVRHICMTFDAHTKYSPWIHQSTKSPVCYQNYLNFISLPCTTGLHFPLITKFVFRSTGTYFWIIIINSKKVICYLLYRQSFKFSHKEFVILRYSTNQLISQILDNRLFILFNDADRGDYGTFRDKKCHFKFL